LLSAVVNMPVELLRVFTKAFNGDSVDALVNRVVQEFRNFFTDDEIKSIGDKFPKLKQVVDQVVALNQRDEGGALYRRLQATLKPKKALTKKQLEAKAKLNEEYDKVLQILKEKYKIEPVIRPGQTKLTAQEKLVLVLNQATSKQMGEAIAQAVKDGEYNAGRAAMLKAAASPEADPAIKKHLALMAADDTVQPLPEYVEQGLNLPEFQHWKQIRDNISYSPDQHEAGAKRHF
jgi:regulator of replication initiation timing